MPTLARKFFNDNVKTWQEYGQWFTDLVTDPTDMNELDYRFMHLKGRDGNTNILVFPDGSIVTYKDDGSHLNFTSKSHAGASLAGLATSHLIDRERAENED